MISMLYTPSIVIFIAVYDVEVAYPKIFTSDKSPHYNNPFLKKHRTRYAEVDM